MFGREAENALEMHDEQVAGANAPTTATRALPQQLRDRAHIAGNGELLWPRPEAIEAARWIAGSGLAIWGGEVYSPRGPLAAMMVAEWRTDPDWRPGDDWPAYVGRGLEQALEAIERLPGPGDLVPARDGVSRSLYFLAYHSPAGFPDEVTANGGHLAPGGQGSRG